MTLVSRTSNLNLYDGAERSRTLSQTAPPPKNVLPLAQGDEAEKKLQEALKKSEIKRLALLATAAELIFIVSKDGKILEFYAPEDNDFMLSAAGLVDRRIKDLLPAQFGQQAMYYLEKTLRTGQMQVLSHQFKLPTGLRHFEARLAVYDAGQVVAQVRDVTDRSYLEREVLEISNREQMRIGQDLHDGLGQHLTGITFLAKALERKLATRSLPEAAEAGEINRLVMQALSQTRSLAQGLFPVELESRGVIPAFRELARQVEEMFAIVCKLDFDETIVIQDRNLAIHLFRLAQEAISNSVKHGKAKHVVVSVQKADGEATLTIRDDGTGFPLEIACTRGLGLRIMSYRAQKIGGNLAIEPGPNGGTTVTCQFKLPRSKA